jgi:transcriptional regulator GlxA family with amidase domain
MTNRTGLVRISLVAIPDAVVSTLTGLYDVLNSFGMFDDDRVGVPPPFAIEIVGEARGPLMLASGIPIEVQCAVDEIAATDIVIVPSILLAKEGWKIGRYPTLVAWAARMHERGAILCSACSGVFLLAETGLFDGRETTVHWGYAQQFQRTFPAVPTSPEKVLVVAGEREQLVTSGASMTWHDLVLYLIARYVGATAAQTAARLFALQWHRDSLAPYVVFAAPTDHGDAVVADAQRWLTKHFSVANPVEEMIKHSGAAERTFKRRFKAATGYSPIDYVQRLRVEAAKRRLERTEASVEEISWNVGYEDPAFFRRLFRRLIGLSPGAYRRRFQVPSYSREPGKARR